jgi:hypothetical protein
MVAIETMGFIGERQFIQSANPSFRAATDNLSEYFTAYFAAGCFPPYIQPCFPGTVIPTK